MEKRFSQYLLLALAVILTLLSGPSTADMPVKVWGSAAAMVKGLIEEMEKVDQFHLAIAPEGTRKAVKKWKTGYHLIAREVGCPVYMGFFDWKTKRVGIGEKVELTDDARADTDRIQAIYETMHFEGKHPEGYITH